MHPDIAANAALLLIDVQNEFDREEHGRRDNLDAEANIGRLVAAWQAAGRPIVRVAQTEDEGGFAPGTHGHAFKDVIADLKPELDVRKGVHSAFHGDTDLDAWLKERAIAQVVICGIQTNRCCESTARIACDLGYDVLFPVDATYTFDKIGPDGAHYPAEQLSAASAASLHGYFATVVRTDDLV